MAFEIERKFLIQNTAFLTSPQEGEQLLSQHKIVQGYIVREAKKVVRVRRVDNRAFLTIKSAPAEGSFTRGEWEWEISLAEALELFELCEAGIIYKTRYKVLYKERLFEVDLFERELAGLALAEIELKSEQENFPTPRWLGQEVTYNPAYQNSNLHKLKRG